MLTWEESREGDESLSTLLPPGILTGESVSPLPWLWLWSTEVSLSKVPAVNFFFCNLKFRRELSAPPPPPSPG